VPILVLAGLNLLAVFPWTDGLATTTTERPVAGTVSAGVAVVATELSHHKAAVVLFAFTALCTVEARNLW
jgi:hypothetical protein